MIKLGNNQILRFGAHFQPSQTHASRQTIPPLLRSDVLPRGFGV